MIKRILILFFLLLPLLLLASCVSVESTDAPTVTTVTESEITTNEKPLGRLSSEEILANPYASSGLELVLKVCEQYYDPSRHALAESLTIRTPTTLWPLMSYIEMLAEAYRMFPENETIYLYYTEALDEALMRYRVSDATIKPPSGKVYTDMTYYNASRFGEGDYYYDDNIWVAIQLLDAYKQLGEPRYLTLAEEVLAFLWTGWDEAYGGMYWDKTYSHKESGNAPCALPYLAAYEITSDPLYLSRAKTVYDWCNRMMRNDKYLYHAGIVNIKTAARDPYNFHPWIAAYDQGTMMLSSTMLYQVTAERRYYDDFSRTARSSVGLMFSTDDQMNGNPIFKSWGVGWILRGVMRVYATDRNQDAARFMAYTANVLDRVLLTKDENGHYDPYFLSGEWWPPEDNPDVTGFDHQVLSPTGVAIVFLLTAHYQLYQAPAS